MLGVPRRRARGVLATLSVALGLFVTPPLHSLPSARTTSLAPAPACASAALRVLTWTDYAAYGPRTSVRVTSAVRNVAATSCTIELGATSPLVRVTSASGTLVWSPCLTSPCSLALVLTTLAPGTMSTHDSIWNQRVDGHDAPRGTYRVLSRVGSATSPRTTFRLASSTAQPTLVLGLAHDGRRVTVSVGSLLVVSLPALANFSWSAPVTSTPALTARFASGGTSALALFRAAHAGATTISATATPRCYPRCLAASRLYRVFVTVR